MGHDFKKAGITRAGFDYQDLMGVSALIDFYQNPDLFEWVRIESDGDAEGIDPGFLDDIFMKRKSDSRVHVQQVKYCVDPSRDDLSMSFKWLFARKGKRGTSLVHKWSTTTLALLNADELGDACLITNRIPDEEIAASLTGEYIDKAKLAPERWKELCAETGGESEAEAFLAHFRFVHTQPMIDDLEWQLRSRLVPEYTDQAGWLYFLNEVRGWAMRKNAPLPEGYITFDELRRAISTKRPKALSQEFHVPDGYSPPSENFEEAIRKRIEGDDVTVLWGTPGRGKSTFLSHLVNQLRESGNVVIRHHYFLSLADTSADRMSFINAADSLIHQMRLYCPEVMAGSSDRTEDLRIYLGRCAQWCADEGKAFIIIIDGLDHVWRERGQAGADQMNHLFSEILPLPDRASLLLGTQRVEERYLPGRLVSHASQDDWIELPQMSGKAVRAWVDTQISDDRVTKPGWVSDEETRARWVTEVSDALLDVSGGHPLHLMYSFESLCNHVGAVREETVRALPACPEGDIRKYYGLLWGSVSPQARQLLHLFATANFPWPLTGMFQCLGEDTAYFDAWSNIKHMFEIRRTAVIPFHGSILAYLQEREDYIENASSLFPRIVQWLENAAPEYWKWAWLWLTKNAAGEHDDLLGGPSREWVINSLTQGRAVDNIHDIIVGAERVALEVEDYPRLVELRALEIRLLNGTDYQTDRFDEFQECALQLANDKTPLEFLLDDVASLSGSELTTAVRLGHGIYPELPERALGIANQVLQYENEFGAERLNDLTNEAETVIQVAAYANPRDPNIPVRFCLGFGRRGEGLFSHFLKELTKVGKFDEIISLWGAADLPALYRHQLALACFRIACTEGIRLDLRPEASDALSHPCCAIWKYAVVGEAVQGVLGALLPAAGDTGDYYGDERRLIGYIHHHFFATLYALLNAEGDCCLVPPKLPERSAGFLMPRMEWLDRQAERLCRLLHAGEAFDITVLTLDVSSLERPGLSADYSDSHSFQRFCIAFRKISVDLHLLAMAMGHCGNVLRAHVEALCSAPIWDADDWRVELIDRGEGLADQDAAKYLVDFGRDSLASRITEMNSRAEEYLELSQLAALYDLRDDAQELLRRSANCIIGYGWRKDIAVFDVLESVELCADAGVGNVAEWLTKLAPAIADITEYTDGKETRHAPGEFAELLGKLAPTWLPDLYKKQVQDEDWSYADRTLTEAIKHIDLSTSDAQALVGTIEGGEALGILKDRAEAGDIDATRLLDERINVLGEDYIFPNLDNSDVTVEEEEKKADHSPPVVDFSQFPPNNFSEFLDLDKGDYDARKSSMCDWLDYWVEQGRGIDALTVLEQAIAEEKSMDVEYLLDHAFEVALKVNGKGGAYPWLVMAHIRKSGWSPYMYGSSTALKRLQRVAGVYPDRWREYVRDVSVPRWSNHADGSVVIGREGLVRLLVLVGEYELAATVTDKLVSIYLEELADVPLGAAPWTQ